VSIRTSLIKEEIEVTFKGGGFRGGSLGFRLRRGLGKKVGMCCETGKGEGALWIFQNSQSDRWVCKEDEGQRTRIFGKAFHLDNHVLEPKDAARTGGAQREKKIEAHTHTLFVRVVKEEEGGGQGEGLKINYTVRKARPSDRPEGVQGGGDSGLRLGPREPFSKGESHDKGLVEIGRWTDPCIHAKTG